MAKPTTEEIAARLDVLSIAMRAVQEALPADQVATVAEQLRVGVGELAGERISAALDSAMASELGVLLGVAHMTRG